MTPSDILPVIASTTANLTANVTAVIPVLTPTVITVVFLVGAIGLLLVLAHKVWHIF